MVLAKTMVIQSMNFLMAIKLIQQCYGSLVIKESLATMHNDNFILAKIIIDMVASFTLEAIINKVSFLIFFFTFFPFLIIFYLFSLHILAHRQNYNN